MNEVVVGSLEKFILHQVAELLAKDTAQRNEKYLTHVAQRLALAAFCLRSSSLRCTERDIYYALNANSLGSSLFTSQSHLSSAIDSLCDGIDQQHGEALVTRECLGISASARSLLAGSLQFVIPAPTGSDCSAGGSPACMGSQSINVALFGRQGIGISTTMGLAAQQFTAGPDSLRLRCCPLPPSCQSSPKKSCPDSRQVFTLVVVEKECSFRHLINVDSVLEKYRCALLCLKGFPCVAARLFLRRYCENFDTTRDELRIITVMDGDIYGLHILLCLFRTPRDDRGWIREAAACRDSRSTTKRKRARESSSSGDAQAEPESHIGNVTRKYFADVVSYFNVVALCTPVGLFSTQLCSLGVPPQHMTQSTPKDVQRAGCLMKHLLMLTAVGNSLLQLCDENDRTTYGDVQHARSVATVALERFAFLSKLVDDCLTVGWKAELQSIQQLSRCSTDGEPLDVLQILTGSS